MAEPNQQHSRKREKPILSCSFCRSRKLRCDRQTPCGACVRRGKAGECTFSTSEQERSHAVDYRPHARRQQARQRVARLEGLVTEMRNQMQTQSQTTPGSAASTTLPSQPVTSSPSNIADDMGKLSLTNDQAVYTGSSHWATILNDIQRLKDELADDQTVEAADLDNDSVFEEPSKQEASLSATPATRISLLNSGPSLSKEQILSAVPSRGIADKHISDFFEYFDMAPFILHRGKFMSEYARFWDNPSSVSVLWLGVLFGVMSISAFLAQHNQQSTPDSTLSTATDGTVQTYRVMAIHCLVAGDYLRPRQYTIEALILHFAIDQILNVDGTVANWVLMGVIIRLALRMGLHRDPSHWPSIRPLQAELRRRLWISLYQMDFFTSVQVGLSRIIKDAQCDAQPPSHLASLDLDQDIGTSELATDSDAIPTPPLFIVQRNGIVTVAAAIYDATEEQPGPSPEKISFLSEQLESAISRVSSAFTYTTFEASITDGAIITLHRVVLDILIQKTIYLLHRRSFSPRVSKADANEADIFASQDKCIKAALSILKHQERLGRETVPGGHLFDIRWKVAASLNHEALQATMMLCFALSSFESTWPQRAVSHEASDKEIRDNITSALTQVKTQWEAKPDLSAETQKALRAVTAVLQRNQKGHITGDQAQSQSLPKIDGSNSQLLPSSEMQGDFFDPMLAFPNPESFDFNMFDYGGSIDPGSIDPLLYDPNFEFDGTTYP